MKPIHSKLHKYIVPADISAGPESSVPQDRNFYHWREKNDTEIEFICVAIMSKVCKTAHSLSEYSHRILIIHPVIILDE